ncbi:MAG: hypothetical protein SF052_11490 [Bacteroidia bacterium]|nr:hypothetical protein [Bacteroidia bacterium]
MKSGHTICINLPTESRGRTPQLLKKMGFVPAGRDILGQRLMSDGTVLLRLDEEYEYGAGILYYSEEMIADRPPGKNLRDEEESEWSQEWQSPEGVSFILLKASPNEIPKAESVQGTPYGTFYEVSLMTTDFQASIEWWQKAGFRLTYGNPETSSFVTLSDDLIRIGLYRPGSCPHIFNNPAITYFDSNMAEKIVAARESGISFAQEITNKENVVSDVIVETEEGWHIFLFSA